ncbi:hypothetical protein G9A89_020877 [Geosiphon pyriformis]|nr:hypothetical protein G9A89_020877 [Geosiphon pyriformis]
MNTKDCLKLANDEERIILNVRGVKYETERSILTAYPETLLGTMFQKRNSQLLQATNLNEYSIDRDGMTFHYIMEYYKTGQISWTGPASQPPIHRRKLDKELDYFLLPSIVLPADLTKQYKSCVQGMKKICRSAFDKKSGETLVKVTLTPTSRFFLVRYLKSGKSVHVPVTPKALEIFGLFGVDIEDEVLEEWPGLIWKIRPIQGGLVIFLKLKKPMNPNLELGKKSWN